MVLSINQIIIIFINFNIMSYTTVESQQITSKDGELSIDVFNDLNQHDNSKLILNCNSYLQDGIKLNCPGGGISLNSQSIDLKSVESKLQSKKLNIETVEKIGISSLESINLSALSSISLSNDNDGIFYNIDNNTIDIVNNEDNSILSLFSNLVNIGSENTTIKNRCKDFTLEYSDNIVFKNSHRKVIHIYSNDNIEISGNVYINGTLKFDKLESTKIKKIKLEDSQNILEFGNDNTKIFEWKILGQHIEGESELSYNTHTNTYSFKYNKQLSNIKAGGLCINSKGFNILEINDDNTYVYNLKSNIITASDLEVKNTLKCGNLEVSGKKVIEHLGNIVNSESDNIRDIISNKEYTFINCDLNENLSIDKEQVNISGYHRNIIWSGKINLKNIVKYSSIKNIIFKNAFISTINCDKLSFINCEFENTKFFSENSYITFNSSNFDINSNLTVNKVLFDKCYIECSIIVNDMCTITLSEMKYDNNNHITLENNSVIYQITNNYITCKTSTNEIFTSKKDMILNDNWINMTSINKSEYQKNSIIKTKNTL